jgi:UDP-N-acetylmuramoyl-tripeptide--D-alanyl-D-alanine ligase
MSVAQAALALSAGGHACRALGDTAAVFEQVSNDTRSLEAGDLYVALRGPRFDGHDFAAAALQRGAAALLVERDLPVDRPQLVVDDSAAALGRLAAHWRARFPLPLIAVAGSNGKTTTTQMIAAILARAFADPAAVAGATAAPPARWHATRGNRNNEIGVPLTLLGLRPWHEAAVIELGMNHPGEIARLAAWARPDVAVVTNAQREHQEFLDSVEATARENGAAIAALSGAGTAVFPADDACAPLWRALAGARRVVDFSVAPATLQDPLPAAVRATARLDSAHAHIGLQTPWGPLELQLALGGAHNARNAVAAASACLAIGVAPDAVAAGLAGFRPVAGRGTRRIGTGGATLIDDSYNANPDSLRAAVDLLAAQPGRRILVMGDMGEVGARAPQFHGEVGAYARARGVDRLLTVGAESAAAAAAFGPGASHHAGVDELIDAVRALLQPPAAGPGGPREPTTVLVKGSRFMRLERVVAALDAAAPGSATSAGVPPGHA